MTESASQIVKVGLGVGVGLAVLLGSVVAGQADSAALGDMAPAFVLPDVRVMERTVRSQDLLPGKTTLISFFATWCRPCKEEIPLFNTLVNRYADRGFQVVIISLDRDERDVAAYLELVDAEEVSMLWDGERKLKTPYGITQLPTNLRVDPDGTIGDRWSGEASEKLKALEAYLENLPKRSP